MKGRRQCIKETFGNYVVYNKSSISGNNNKCITLTLYALHYFTTYNQILSIPDDFIVYLSSRHNTGLTDCRCGVGIRVRRGLKTSRERMDWSFSHALGTVVVINVVFEIEDGERGLVSFDTAGTSELNALPE